MMNGFNNIIYLIVTLLIIVGVISLVFTLLPYVLVVLAIFWIYRYLKNRSNYRKKNQNKNTYKYETEEGYKEHNNDVIDVDYEEINK